MTASRPDLLESLLKACWLVENARASVYASWGEGYAGHFERTERRAKLVGDALLAASVELPVDVLPAHAAWVKSVVGETPESVPLGPALMQRVGEWTNVYVVNSLRSDPQTFLALGEAELLFPVPPRTIERAEAFLPVADPPPGPRFVVLTDMHLGANGAEALARHAVAEINALEPEFVVVPGDITDDGEPEQFALARSVLAELECPWHAVLGNHDAVRRSTRSGEGASLFEATFGVPASDVVMMCGGTQVALLDTTDPTPSPFPDWDLNRGGFREDAGGVPNGAVSSDQVSSLIAALDPSRPVVLVQHHELQPFTGFPPVQFGVRPADSNALVTGLSSFDVVGVIAGHTHRSALTAVGPAGEWEQLEVPSLKDWPHCYTVVGVSDAGVRAVVRQVGDADLLDEPAAKLTPIYRNYVTGALSTLDKSFGSRS